MTATTTATEPGGTLGASSGDNLDTTPPRYLPDFNLPASIYLSNTKGASRICSRPISLLFLELSRWTRRKKNRRLGVTAQAAFLLRVHHARLILPRPDQNARHCGRNQNYEAQSEDHWDCFSHTLLKKRSVLLFILYNNLY
jgi:hypothetical protein